MKIRNIILLFLLLSACSTHGINKVINTAEVSSDTGKLAVAVRISEETVLKYNSFADNLQLWFVGQDSGDSVVFLEENETFSKYKNGNVRFYQENAGKNFLKYKSLGLLKLFIAENRGKIQETLRENGAEALLIYEIGGSFSKNMKVIRYDTLVVIVNRDNEIVYMDHQKEFINDGDFDRDLIDKEFFDTISRRLYSTLLDLGYIKSK